MSLDPISCLKADNKLDLLARVPIRARRSAGGRDRLSAKDNLERRAIVKLGSGPFAVKHQHLVFES